MEGAQGKQSKLERTAGCRQHRSSALPKEGEAVGRKDPGPPPSSMGNCVKGTGSNAARELEGKSLTESIMQTLLGKLDSAKQTQARTPLHPSKIQAQRSPVMFLEEKIKRGPVMKPGKRDHSGQWQ